MCPSTDPAAILPTMPYFPYNVVAGNAQCANLITGNDCHSYGYDLPNFNTSLTTTYYSEGDLPANGTNGIFNNPGSVTSPLYPTLTWQLGAGMETQTAIAITTGSAAGVASASASGNGGASSSGSGSISSAAATSGSGGTVTGSGGTTNSATASASTTASKSGAVASRGGVESLLCCLTFAATVALLL